MLFSRYVRSIEIYPHLERLFGALRKSGKGQAVSALFTSSIIHIHGRSYRLREIDGLLKQPLGINSTT